MPQLSEEQLQKEKERVFAPLLRGGNFDGVSAIAMRERLQRLMDEYAGGVSQFYRTNEERLDYAISNIKMLQSQFQFLYAANLHELLQCLETMDRVDVAEAVCYHLKERKETRWEGWADTV